MAPKGLQHPCLPEKERDALEKSKASRLCILFERIQNQCLQLLLLFHLGKALAAVNRSVFTGSEGNSRLFATGRAGCCEHLSLGSGGVFARIAACFASLGLIDKASGSIKLLLACGEYKLCATLFAC